ncbi:hypothetical protein NFI96_005915 [Prochilodus magdalenae]|nr:hypothetical protein NFI96_005915 [Prochilodus magdalenae]
MRALHRRDVGQRLVRPAGRQTAAETLLTWTRSGAPALRRGERERTPALLEDDKHSNTDLWNLQFVFPAMIPSDWTNCGHQPANERTVLFGLLGWTDSEVVSVPPSDWLTLSSSAYRSSGLGGEPSPVNPVHRSGSACSRTPPVPAPLCRCAPRGEAPVGACTV